jgi:hypothetical protein
MKKHRKMMKARDVGYVTYLAFCTVHEKKAFTRKNARKVKRDLHDPGMRAYECDQGGDMQSPWWHVGHLPGVVKRGEVSAIEVYENTGS